MNHQHNDISQLMVLGPDCVAAWTFDNHVDRLCGRCQITFQRVDEPEGWEVDSVEAEFIIPSDRIKILWTDENGPTILEVRNSAHLGCHFCTMIISRWLFGRRNLRLGAEQRGIGLGRRAQDNLCENDRVHLLISNYLGRNWKLTGGVRIWCADDDPAAAELLSNIDGRRTDRLTRRETTYSWGSLIRESLHQLASFSFDTIENTTSPAFEESSVQEFNIPNVQDLNDGENFSEVDSDRYNSQSPSMISLQELEIQSQNYDPPDMWMRAEHIASYWLEDCLLNHDCGGMDSIDPILPRRVIDVRGRGERPEPFLVHTHGERARYVTLSYRWGQSRQVTTTTKNVNERHHSISLIGMPRTYKDVIQFTRELGIQYLWIDALCIIQDSKEDCLKELSGMGDIYNNSTITIAAVGSLNADDGCNPDRNKLAMCDCRVPNRKITSHGHSSNTSLLKSGSIHQRGWCFQETEIAPRLLSVGLSQLYWQCRKGLRRECEPAIIEDAYDYIFQKQEQNQIVKIQTWPIRNRFFDDATISDPLQAYSRWYWLIEHYTERLLTFYSDKLPALSALASRFMGLFEIVEDKPYPSDYCCGIWRQDLLAGLLWRYHPDHPKIPHGPFRAPSWSWAASYNDVSFDLDIYPRPEISFHTTVLDVVIELVSDVTPFGEVRSGKITLVGPVAPLPEACYPHSLGLQRYKSETSSETSYGAVIQELESNYSNAELVPIDDNSITHPQTVDEGSGSVVRGDEPPVRKSSRPFSEVLEGADPIFREDNNSSAREPSPSLSEILSRKDDSPSSRICHSNRSTYETVNTSDTENIWRAGKNLWQHVCWDTDEVQTNDCKMIRVTHDHAIIISPIRKPGIVGNEKGCCGGVYKRVGLVDVGFKFRPAEDVERMDSRFSYTWEKLDKLRFVFDALGWKDELVTVI